MKRFVVEKANILHNISVLREMMPEVKLIAALKGNGYGMGMLPLAGTVLEAGAELLAVSNLEEARVLRAGGIDAEILLMSSTVVPENAEEIVRLGLTAAIGSVESAVLLNTAARNQSAEVKAHIKIDTGFGRFGFLPEETDKILAAAHALTNVKIAGIFSHLTSSFAKKRKLVDGPLALFGGTISTLEKEGMSFELKHIANSCAALQYPESRYNAIRVASALVGRVPVKNIYGLKRVGFLECDIDEVRFLPAKHTVGYANTFTTKRPTKIAVLSAGYFDGIALGRSRDIGRVRFIIRTILNTLRQKGPGCTIGGKRARILGRVGLTNCVIDVTNIPCSAGDIAVVEINPLLVDSSVERVYR